MKAHGLNDLYAAAMEHSIKIAEVLAVHEKGETSDVSDIENILSGDEDKSPKALKGANMLRQDISKGGHSGAEKRHDTQFYHMRMEAMDLNGESPWKDYAERIKKMTQRMDEKTAADLQTALKNRKPPSLMAKLFNKNQFKDTGAYSLCKEFCRMQHVLASLRIAMNGDVTSDNGFRAASLRDFTHQDKLPEKTMEWTELAADIRKKLEPEVKDKKTFQMPGRNSATFELVEWSDGGYGIVEGIAYSTKIIPFASEDAARRRFDEIKSHPTRTDTSIVRDTLHGRKTDKKPQNAM